MSYSKPKQINTGALELNQTLLNQTLKRSSQREATQQKRTSDNLSSLTNIATTLASQAIAPKADGLATLNKDYAKQTQKLYKKIGSSGFDLGDAGSDKKADALLNGFIDDYFAIKSNIGNTKDPSLAMQDLANIENMIDSYGTGVTNMLAYNKAIEAASKEDINSGNKLSVAGPPVAQLQIIRKATSGDDSSKDIEYRREGNNIILYDTTTKTSLNITEFNAAQDRGEQYLKYATATEDLTTGFYNDIIKNKNDEEAFNPKFVTKGEDENYSMTFEQQESYKNDLKGYDPKKPNQKSTGNNNFSGLLEGPENHAESIWEDQIYQDGGALDQWPTGDQEIAIPFGKEFITTDLSSDQIIANAKRPNATKDDKELYDAFYAAYYEPSLTFLADQSLRGGASSNQITLNPKVDPAVADPATTVADPADPVVDPVVPAEVVADEEVDDFVSNTGSTIFNYEDKFGSAGGGGLKDFGFTNEKYKDKKYDKYRDDNGDLTKEGAQIIFEEEYMSQVPSEYPNQIKQQLADYKFNSSMSTLDLMLLANGDITLREARDDAEHKDLWKEKKEEVEKLMNDDPAAFNEKIKQAKRDIYKDLNPEKYENTWKNRIDMFDKKEDTASKVDPILNDEADAIFGKDEKDEKSKKEEISSYTKLMKPEEIKIVDSFSIENTGENKANILKDGKPIVSNKNGVTVTGLRAEGNSVIVDAKILGIKGTGDLGSFKIEGNKVIFNEGSDYQKLEGADKIDFDTFKKAMELDIAYATEIQKQIKGEA